MRILRKWPFWAWPSELRRHGVLGINARNIRFLYRLNSREFYPRVDDKVLTKQICLAKGIPVPATYAVIERFGDIGKLPELIHSRYQFVVKPASGSGGCGILVITSRNGSQFETSDARRLSLAELRYHVSSTLSGLYSLGSRPDRAIVEQRIVSHPVFDGLTVGGTPDIRIIVYRNVPLMAMLRLPTHASKGRANLHQGAVGVGIHLSTGRTCGGVFQDKAVETHPDTGAPIAGVQLPHWDEMLTAAACLSKELELGYVGVDMMLDAEKGPLVLEANARPGLAIQVANRSGLLSRVEKLDKVEHG